MDPEEEEELEEFVRETFLYEEIDLDYEFDAARFFDFNRTETEWEDRLAESWFESARGYPPSRECSPIALLSFIHAFVFLQSSLLIPIFPLKKRNVFFFF